ALMASAALVVAPSTPAPAATQAVRWDPRVAPIARAVEKIRHLKFKHAVPVRFMTPAAVEARLRANLGRASPRLRALTVFGGTVMKALGLIPRHFDTARGTADQLSTGIFAYFDGRQVIVKGLTVNELVEVVL